MLTHTHVCIVVKKDVTGFFLLNFDSIADIFCLVVVVVVEKVGEDVCIYLCYCDERSATSCVCVLNNWMGCFLSATGIFV